jgi:signal transduction histidine kinase
MILEICPISSLKSRPTSSKMPLTLTNRLMAFFLVALAIVLTAFSIAIFFFARFDLNHELEDRAAATLETLVAACEVHQNGIEWEPQQHQISFWHEDQPTIWAVFDQSGHMVDSSQELTFPVSEFSRSNAPVNSITQENYKWTNQEWRIFKIRLDSGNYKNAKVSERKKLHQGLVFITAWPLKTMSYSLSRLAWTLTFVAGSAWIIAAVLGRWFCKKALAPLSDMSKAVKRITADHLSYRLDSMPTRDELQLLSEAFNGLMDRLEYSFAQQSRFTSEASHQMRTPLTAMLGQLDVALRRERDPAEYQRVLNSARLQVIRLQKIVELLLFLARADAESITSKLENIHLTQWLKDHLNTSWNDHPRSNDIKIEINESLKTVLQSHSAMLGQAIDNLIDNAIKYSDSGSKVIVRVATPAGSTIIEVQDFGKGIKETESAQVFDPFFRSSDNRNNGIEGFGLGLAIVSRIATALDAEYSVMSKLGEGSTFQLKFKNRV